MTISDTQHEAVRALLSARAVVYALMARMWAEPLDQAALDALSAAEWDEVLALLDGDSDGDAAADASLGRQRAQLAATTQALGAEECQRAFNWCFMGVGTRVAPWESVYATPDRLVMQPSTLQVRDAYARAGFVAKNKGSEPDDHVATECDFMAKLAERALAAFDEGDEAACAKALGQSRDFLRDHLGKRAGAFKDAFAEAVEKAGEGADGSPARNALALYGAAAAFDEAFFAVDEELLAELLVSLEKGDAA